MTITALLTDPDGTVHRVTARQGQSLMRAALAAGVEGIAADCGGSLTCATCHVIVQDDWSLRLPAPSADEQAMLEMTATPPQPSSRLSCQILMRPELDGFCATLPASQY
jgi:2Fe-2S ferredoxin